MKKTWVLIILLSIAQIVHAQQTKKALFIGNSYTFYNSGVGYWVEKIASSLGDSFVYSSVAPGGYTFQAHCTYAETLSAIADGSWDYVVLQEQSQRPSFPPAQVAQEVYPYATQLCEYIRDANECSIPLFFMTWGRENGDQSNCAAYPPLCTFDGMQLRLRQSYIEMAVDNNAQVSPVGMVWKTVRDSLNDELVLYAGDQSHPSLLGTYLTACTIYASIFHKSPEGAMIPIDLNEADALAVQYWVNRIVFDSLDTWRIDTTKVYAQFNQEYLVKDSEWVQGYLSNWSINADSCYWNFGDGTDLWQYPIVPNEWDMVFHNFPEEDYYTICLTAYSGCKSDSVCKTEFIFPQGGNSIQPIHQKGPELFPNPVSDVFTFDNIFMESIQHIEIVDLSGRIVLEFARTESAHYDVSSLKPGIYTVLIKSNEYTTSVKLIKQ